MKNELLLKELEQIAARFDFKVVYGSLELGQGGDCRVKDKKYIIINKSLPLKTRVEILGQFLLKQDLEIIYILPWVRGYLEKLKESFSPDIKIFT